MEQNLQESKFKVILKKIWPVVHRIINVTVYAIINLLKSFFRDVMQMIKGA